MDEDILLALSLRPQDDEERTGDPLLETGSDDILLALSKRPPGDREPDLHPSPGIVEGFAKTALHEFGPGLIGVKPSDDVAAFQRDHPYLSIGALAAGAAIPYGLGAKIGLTAALKVPGLARLAKFGLDAERIAKAPASTAAVREVARFAPFQIARLAGAAALGDEGAVERTAQSIAIETPLFAATGGIGAVLARSKPLPGVQRGAEGRIADKFHDYEFNEAPQVKLQKISQILKSAPDDVTEDIKPDLYDVKRGLQKTVREQDPPDKVAFVQKLEDGRSAAGVSKLFRGSIPGVSSYKFTPSSLRSADAVEDAIRRSVPKGYLEDFESLVQYPRLLRATDAAGGVKLRETIIKEFKNNKIAGKPGVGETYLAKEQDGVYVMARRIKGTAKTPGKGDEFVVFKTTNPSAFTPDAARFSELLTKGAFHHETGVVLDAAARGIPQAKFISSLSKQLDNPDLTGSVKIQVADAVEKALSKEIADAGKEAAKGINALKEQLKIIVSPAIHEFSRDPNALKVMNIARMAYAVGTARASALFFGKEIGKGKGKNLFAQILGSSERQGGIEKLIDALTEEDLLQVRQVFNESMSIAQAQAEGFSRNTVNLLRKLEKVDQGYMKWLGGLEAVVGEPLLNPLANHFMLTRSWVGKWRIPLHEKVPGSEALGARVIGYASGHGRADALKDAEAIVKQVAESGTSIGFNKNNILQVGRDLDLSLAREIDWASLAAKKVRNARTTMFKHVPVRFKERTGAIGYKTNLEKNDLKAIIYGNMIENERTLNSHLIPHILASDINKVAARAGSTTAPIGLHKQLVQRLNSLAGIEGPISRKITEAADLVLAPFLGKGGASEIVRQTNQLMFSATLAFGDFGFPVVNAMTPIMTVLPEISFLITAPPARLAPYYTSALVWGKSGPVSVRHLDPIRILGKSLRSMAKPDDELRSMMAKAEQLGVVSPKYVEEFHGQNSNTVKNFSAVLKGEEGFISWLKELNKFLPARSEELTRGISFTSGYHVGKDFFQLEGDRLFQFASEFVARTNFLYSVADRPRVLTGLAGTAFGLFKNWGMHQVGNMMVYSGEAAARKNAAPLLWMMGGTAFLGGLGGLPLYGVADSMSEFLSDKPLVQNVYDGMGLVGTPDKVVDAFMYGMPAFLGISLQGRVAPTGAQIARDVQFLTQSATLDRAFALADALGDLGDIWFKTGIHPVSSSNTRAKFYRALLPRTLYRSLSFTEDRALQSLRTGNALTSAVNLPERFLYTTGFSPVDIEKTLEASEALFRNQERSRERVSVFGKALAELEREGDLKGISTVYKRAVSDNVDLGAIRNSADAFTSKENEGVVDRQFDFYLKERLKQSLFGGRF